MPKTDTASPPGGQLERGAMGTADIVFFVLAGFAPMGVVVALLTLSIALGNGAGVPGTYAVAGLVLALFAAGYVRMSRRITNVGGFYELPAAHRRFNIWHDLSLSFERSTKILARALAPAA